MTSLAASFARPRKSFAKIPAAVEIPYLIEIQRNSYQQFLQMDVDPEKRKNVGLEGVFRSVFPIRWWRSNIIWIRTGSSRATSFPSSAAAIASMKCSAASAR